MNFHQKIFAALSRSCMNPLMNAMSLVMAGSGNLEVMNLLLTIQNQVNVDITYGSHISVNMSLGLLFLSNGTNTIGTSNKAIAALFCSFYPIYPSSPTDNRSHLQALRHLWVLAIERRCLITRDVETGKVVRVPISVHSKQGNLQEDSPLILPEFSTIHSIHVVGPRYWSTSIPFQDLMKSGLFQNTIWVQRKTRFLPSTEVF